MYFYHNHLEINTYGKRNQRRNGDTINETNYFSNRLILINDESSSETSSFYIFVINIVNENKSKLILLFL